LCCYFALYISGKGFFNSIRSTFDQWEPSKNGYIDIYDGELYKAVVGSGLLSQIENISLMINTDGIPIFKSSNVAAWPVYLMINELPYRSRLGIICFIQVYNVVCALNSSHAELLLFNATLLS